ncbi:hypothetical protein [Streptomyces sp. NPDC055912]|uniref:hypothetical protein n=1 Tax=Streptomyces sp. NPDC055912 TaxID=3345660 RepID=UPI0035D55DBD
MKQIYPAADPVVRLDFAGRAVLLVGELRVEMHVRPLTPEESQGALGDVRITGSATACGVNLGEASSNAESYNPEALREIFDGVVHDAAHRARQTLDSLAEVHGRMQPE